MKKFIPLIFSSFVLVGCTTVKITQKDESPERTVSTDVKATAWFSSSQNITKIKTSQTDKTQSTGTEGMTQHGATNAIEALKVINDILGKVRP